MAVVKKIRTKERDGRMLPSNEPRSYEISEMRAAHYRMVELAFLGYKEVEIAEFLNRTPQNVSDVLNSELAQVHLEELQLQRDENSISIAKQMKEIAPEALRLMKTSLIRANQDMVKDPEKKIDRIHMNIAQDILDRTGNGPPKNTNQLHLHLTKNSINNIKSFEGDEDEIKVI